MINTSDEHIKASKAKALDIILTEISSQSHYYGEMLLEYCLLALKPMLTEIEQDRLAEIYALGTEDAVLSFWLEEADHLVAHHLRLIDEGFIKSQQDKFRRSMGQGWIDNLWHDLQSRNKVLQAYLHRQGIYHGSIDGVMGPSTQEALRQLLEKQPNALTGLGLI